MRRDFKNGTWYVWTGPSEDRLTLVGSYGGIADAMMEADEQEQEYGEACIVVTDVDVLDDDGRVILDESSRVTVRLRWNA